MGNSQESESLAGSGISFQGESVSLRMMLLKWVSTMVTLKGESHVSPLKRMEIF